MPASKKTANTSAIDPEKIQKVLLIVLDGFGVGKNYPFNAIQNAKMPFYRELCGKFPQARLLTCGEAVGLPPGVMGNSEVGHTNMGAGRIVYQELTRINKSIHDGEFQKNPELLGAIQAAEKAGGRVHLLGLLSDAGVHSDLKHLETLIRMASERVPVTVHVFTDGRDTPPTSATGYLKHLGEFLRGFPHACVGSVSGRYYAMDRDNRWDRVEKAWKALTGKIDPYAHRKGNGVGAALQIVEESHRNQVTDEFVLPTRLEPESGRGAIADGDAVIFYNFRSDRARQLTRAFTEEGFKEFDTGPRPKLSKFVMMTRYDRKFTLPAAFEPQNLNRILPEILADLHLKQFRIAETEKYAHVTFFFNGGRELVYPGEERVLIASPRDVATYDLKPEMSAPEVSAKLAAKLSQSEAHFALVNFANPDMIGHTGNYDAAVRALVAVDKCLDQVVSAALGGGYDVLITADHGNIEEMCDAHGEPHTQHTLNPVPVHYISKNHTRKLHDGILADLAPTILQTMGLPTPAEMTGKTLFGEKP